MIASDMSSLGPVYMRKKPHLPDPALTGEVNFSHCLHEIFTSLVSPGLGAEKRGEVKSLFVKSERTEQ